MRVDFRIYGRAREASVRSYENVQRTEIAAPRFWDCSAASWCVYLAGDVAVGNVGGFNRFPDFCFEIFVDWAVHAVNFICKRNAIRCSCKVSKFVLKKRNIVENIFYLVLTYIEI